MSFVTPGLLQIGCAEIDWVEKGTIPITKTFDDIQRYHKFAILRWVMYTYLINKDNNSNIHYYSKQEINDMSGFKNDKYHPNLLSVGQLGER